MLRWISPPVDNPQKPWRRRVFQWRYHGLCPWGSMGSLEDGFPSLRLFSLTPPLPTGRQALPRGEIGVRGTRVWASVLISQGCLQILIRR